MAVDTKLVQQIREQTGAGVLDIKKALDEANNDEQKAIELLRKRGQKVAAKKADRATGEGVVEAYIHGEGRIGVLVKLVCETDFVARTPQFKELARQIGMHIAAFSPQYLQRSDVPEEIVAREKDIYTVQLEKEGKPAEVIEKIMTGKLDKFFSEVCLLEQEFVTDDTKSVQDVINERIAELGENILVAEYKRIAL